MMTVVRMCLLKIAIGNDSFYYGWAYLLSDLYYNARPTRYKKNPTIVGFLFCVGARFKISGLFIQFFCPIVIWEIQP